MSETVSSVQEAMLASIRRYRTSADGCACPDRRYRRHECKHMRAVRYAYLVMAAIAQGASEDAA